MVKARVWYPTLVYHAALFEMVIARYQVVVHTRLPNVRLRMVHQLRYRPMLKWGPEEEGLQ